MKKAINLYVAPSDTLEKIKSIKEVGFDEIAIGFDNLTENIKLDDVVKTLKNFDFNITYMHCAYFEPELKYIWLDDEKGEKVIKDLIRQIEETSKFEIKDFIIHTNGDFNPPVSKMGIERIKVLISRCKQYGMNLCIENLYDYNQFKFIFENIQDESLKICFDCGHYNCLTPSAPLVEQFCDKIEVLHLHDNHGPIANGTGDEHLILGKGNIDLDNLARKIADMKDDIVLCAEYKVKTGKIDKEFFVEAKQSLDNLEKLVMKYKSQK